MKVINRPFYRYNNRKCPYFIRTFFMKQVLLICIAIIPCFLVAQDGGSFEDHVKKAVKQAPSPEFKFYSRSSFISNAPVNVFGVKAGINYDNTISYGIGYNRLQSPVYKWINDSPVTKSLYRLRFQYGSAYAEYTFYSDKRWEFNIPVQLGLGYTDYINNSNGKSIDGGWVAMYEPAIIANYRIVKFISIGMGAGYRLMIITNHKLGEQLTVPQYIFRVKFHLKEILGSDNRRNPQENE